VCKSRAWAVDRQYHSNDSLVSLRQGVCQCKHLFALNQPKNGWPERLSLTHSLRVSAAVQMSPSAVTVVKPDGQVQAVLNLAEGNSTIRIQPSATSTGFITISQPNGPSAQVNI
jgi:hypothetical protein